MWPQDKGPRRCEATTATSWGSHRGRAFPFLSMPREVPGAETGSAAEQLPAGTVECSVLVHGVAQAGKWVANWVPLSSPAPACSSCSLGEPRPTGACAAWALKRQDPRARAGMVRRAETGAVCRNSGCCGASCRAVAAVPQQVREHRLCW